MKTGLVLEGGALRAVFSSGVCDALMEADVMTDYLIGVSAGIAYGVSYASRQPGRNLKVATTYAPDPRYMGWRNLLNRENRSYFGLKFAYETIPNELVPFDYDAFEAFEGQVETVVTNMNTGKAEYLAVPRRDKKGTVIQASCALPILFPSYEINGQPCMDGGIVDSFPWRRAMEQGCERVIVVMTRPRDYIRGQEKTMPLIRRRYRKYPNFVDAMQRRADRYNEARAQVFEEEKKGNLLVILPDTTYGVSRTERDTEKLRLLWAEGHRQATQRMDEIRRYLGK